jgi:hypothetical protein
MMAIIDNSGIQMSATAKDALSTGKTLEQYAVTMLSVHAGKPQANANVLPMVPAVNPQEEATFSDSNEDVYSLFKAKATA